MKKILLSIFLLTITSISFSQIRLSGTIIDVFTKTPLAKAIVTVNGSDNTLITDENGFFTVMLKESGVYDVQVSKNGYKSLVETLMLNESIELQIMLTSNAGTADPTISKKIIEDDSEKARYLDREINSKEEDIQADTKTIVDKSKAEKEKLANAKTPKIKESKTGEAKTMAPNKKNTVSKSQTISIEKNKIKEENTTTVFSGIISDKYTKEALAGSEISFNGLKRKFYSNAEGYFYATVPSSEKLTMSVKMNGYESVSDNIPALSDLELDVFLTKKLDSGILELFTEDVVISRTRATETTPTTFRKVKKEELEENNLGKDLPYLLELTPSVVATSDGGNGTGYTSMRIRGSDITRINFTLNGFPVNDAESQNVFLVNTPDLASGINDIQIQRGIGTSTNGAAAFGASVNINTNKLSENPYAEFNNSFGTYGTFKNTVKLGTGEIFKHFSFDGRFSHIATDGYIDRSAAKLFAYTLTGTYYNKNSMIRFNVISGNERTQQAWNGVDYNTMQNNRTFNSSGTDYGQKTIAYGNEIDKYKQDNYQLAFSHQFGSSFNANLGFHYTKGKGFFEQYKVDQDLIEYGIINSSGNTDLVRRRWLDNDFYGAIFSLNLKKGKTNATLGGGWNQYDGDHFGEVTWAKDAQNLTKDEIYYFNNGLKTDFNTFLKIEYKLLKRLVVFGDVQYRRVSYSADGLDNDQKRINEDVDYNFVNPKLGITILTGKKLRSQLYASFAMANREPTRNDFIDNDSDPKPENMMDFELGFRHADKKLNYGINAFYMIYKDQLVLTGALNDVGSAVRANVDNSFRTGLELELAYEPVKFFGLRAAGTWSLNEIKEFKFFNNKNELEIHDKTKIAYSPALIGNLTLYTKAFKGFELALINKYVGEQFLDNTSSKNKILLPYFLNDARLSYSIVPKFMSEIQFVLKANNIFNVKYASNGYVFSETPYFYPQAGTNFEGAINLKF